MKRSNLPPFSVHYVGKLVKIHTSLSSNEHPAVKLCGVAIAHAALVCLFVRYKVLDALFRQIKIIREFGACIDFVQLSALAIGAISVCVGCASLNCCILLVTLKVNKTRFDYKIEQNFTGVYFN